MTASSHRLGTVLVAVQFLLIGCCVAPVGPVLAIERFRAVGVVLLGLGAVLGAAALLGLGADTRIHPVPGDGITLRTRGIYSQVRHPMYGAVLLCCLGATLLSGRLLALVAVLCLAGVLVAKSRLEDRLLLQRFGPAFAAYAARVPALIPSPRRRR